MKTAHLKNRQVIFILLVIFSNFLFAGILYVDDDNTSGPWNGSSIHPYQFIQDAVTTSTAGTTIVVMPGTYFENVSIHGKTIALTSLDPDDPSTVATTTINGQQLDSAVSVINSVAFIGGFTITNGLGEDGGGVYSVSSSPVFINCLVAQNATGNGGDSYAVPGDGGSGGGLYCTASPQIIHCTVTGNTAGSGGIQLFWMDSAGTDGTGAGIQCTGSSVLKNCIVWDNWPDQLAGHSCSNVSYSDIDDGICAGSSGNITIDPLFADSGNDDYHLQSAVGRWTSGSWVTDMFTSFCIDGGDPTDPVTKEYNPNGSCVNMGAYGNTIEASKSLSRPGPDPTPDCVNQPKLDTNFDCKVNLVDFAEFASQWLACGYDIPEAC